MEHGGTLGSRGYSEEATPAPIEMGMQASATGVLITFVVEMWQRSELPLMRLLYTTQRHV